MEELIEKIPQVTKCGVIVSMDDERGNVPIVFVTLNSAESNKEIKTQILMTIEENLPPYYSPKDVVVLDDMPITTSQKIDYRALEREAENY